MTFNEQTVPQVEPIKVLGMVLRSEMELIETQIMLGKENYKIPPTEGLYIALLYGPDQVVGNNNYNATNSHDDYLEVQDVAMLHQIDVEVMSFNSEARTRKQEVLQSVASYYAQSLMELYQMRIMNLPGAFIPVEAVEETKQLNRFKLTLAMNALWRKTKKTPFYDSLQEVDLVENP